MEEIFTCPFTTQTTCYSCGRNNNSEGSLTAADPCELHFATENNLLAVQIAKNDVKTACRPLPRDSAQMTCVGYASLSNEQQHIEAMALLDPELLEDSETSPPNLHRPSTIFQEKDDNTSVATPKSQLKRSSTLSSTSAATTNSPLLSSSYHRMSQSELSKASQATIATSDTQQTVPNGNGNANSNGNSEADKNTGDDHLAPQPNSKARLVLKQNQYSDPESAPEQQLSSSAFALLDFRPLCPCISKWRHHANESPFLGIWVGSADDAILRLYAPSDDPRKLVPIPLPEEHFSVDSPVMALDFCSVSWNDTNDSNSTTTTTTHTLAIACQDGTDHP